MKKILENYKNWLEINGISSNTITQYSQRINKVLKQIPIKKLSEKSISEFLLTLKQKYQPKTVNVYNDTIKSFLN